MSPRLREELAWGLADLAAVALCVMLSPLAVVLWVADRRGAASRRKPLP